MSYTLQNFYKSTLTLDWTIGTGNFYVAVAPTQSTGWLVISPNNSTIREIIKYTATGTDSNGPYVTVSVRGVGGTTEQIHTVGEPIRMNITAEYWNDMNTDIANIVASGVSNANTTTMGGLEIATPAEVDAGTATGGTGASLALTPDNVNTAHNIPFVAPGTSGNLMTSNGTDWVSSTVLSVLPTPAFFQKLPTGLTTDTPTTINSAMGSNATGSVIYAWNSNNVFQRYERDSLSGTYFFTHQVNPTFGVSAASSIVTIGNYVYIVGTGTSTVQIRRFDADTLANETTCTNPTPSVTGALTSWTDGTYLYWVDAGNPTTVSKWSLSGTTFSSVSTSTCPSGYTSHSTTMFDGTNIYLMSEASSTQYQIVKISDPTFASVTSTTNKLTNGGATSYWSSTNGGKFLINIDANKMYVGSYEVIFNASAQYTAHIVLIPVTKP